MQQRDKARQWPDQRQGPQEAVVSSAILVAQLHTWRHTEIALVGPRSRTMTFSTAQRNQLAQARQARRDQRPKFGVVSSGASFIPSDRVFGRHLTPEPSSTNKSNEKIQTLGADQGEQAESITVQVTELETSASKTKYVRLNDGREFPALGASGPKKVKVAWSKLF